MIQRSNKECPRTAADTIRLGAAEPVAKLVDAAGFNQGVFAILFC